MALRNQQLLQALMARSGTAAAVPASTLRTPTMRTQGLLEQLQQQYPYQAGRREMGFDPAAAQSNILPGLVERGMDGKMMMEEPVETGIGLAELGKGALQIAGAAPTLALGSERARQAARRRLEGNPVAMMLQGGVRELRDLVGEKGVMGALGSMGNRPVDVAEMMLGVVPAGAVPKAARAAKLIRRDKEFVTGKPVQFEFLHNTESAPDMGSQFGQDIEPAGRYLLEKDVSGPAPPNWETGEISFENPLVIEHGDTRDWKKRLSATYEGKTGQELSDAVRADGHDGIVTIDSRAGQTSEIVDLQTFKQSNPLDFSQDDLIEQAEKQFGITDDWNEAGYLTPHGDLLDFSGKAQGGESGVRHMDHREVSSLGQDIVTGEGPEMLLDAVNDLGSARGYMIDFINRGGAMRIMKGDPSTLSIDYGPFPTARQKQMILKEARNAEYVAIDQIGEDGYPIRRFSKDFPLSSDIAEFLDDSAK